MTRKPRVLVLALYFLPSEQGGGLVRAVDYLVEHLREDFDFVIATSDHDLQDPEPYSEAARQDARRRTGVDIRYLPDRGRWRALLDLFAEGFDLLYMNSFLSRGFTLLPLLAYRLSNQQMPLLLAPRGELMAGAMQHKWRRKHIYLRILQASGLLRDVQFHVTSADEAAELRLLGVTRLLQAPDLPPRNEPPLEPLHPSWPGKPLRVLFGARIDRKKNLGAALSALALVREAVNLDIIGPIGDSAYWAACQPLFAALPAHVSARYLGPQSHAELQRSMGDYELLFLPTRAENNGYVMLEALLAGCALLISNATPWRNLQALEIGWDLPTDDIPAFARALDDFARMAPAERLRRRQLARVFGRSRLQASADVDTTRALLLRACSP